MENATDKFTPSEEQKKWMDKLFTDGKALVDADFKTPGITVSQDEAKKRRELVSHVNYDWALGIKKGDYFVGQATCDFYLQKMPENDTELFMDFNALALSELKINGKDCMDEKYFSKWRIRLAPEDLKKGWNKVSTKYFTPYSKTQTGLHQFIDEADKEQYLYTQFESHYCQKVFPSFDQPSMKAKMKLNAIVPQAWIAVSNGIDTRYEKALEEGSHVLEKNDMMWMTEFYEDKTTVCSYEFEETPTISTYLYAVCAGPYTSMEDYDPMYPPQRCFVRQSLAKNLNHELVFGITKTTLDYYQKQFNRRYPFSKVDHVMCPDYKFGAMENVGCITYADSIMCGSAQMAIPQLTFICVVIQHELCHMWFGNLVTMEWWDDLWLNESFATSISYYACAAGGPHVDDFKEESWLHFMNYKKMGISHDMLPTNHNIQADIKNTQMVDSIIDGITYGKGASCLKQLVFLMGWEAFTTGIKGYFKEYAWKNTNLQNFIDKLQEGYNKTIENGDLDLNKWAEQWLRTKGPNKISVEYTQDGGVIKSFKIKQGFCKFGDEVCRQQSIHLGFFDEENKMEEHYVNLQAQEFTDLPQFVGKKVPRAVLQNSGDWGFGVFLIDEASQKFFEQNMQAIDKKLNKSVVITQFLAMLEQVLYPITRMPILLNQMMEEENQNVITTLYRSTLVNSKALLPTEYGKEFYKGIADFFFKKALKEKDNKSLLLFCIDKAIECSLDKENLEIVCGWITNGKVEVEGTQLDHQLTEDQKYNALKLLYSSPDFDLEKKKAVREVIFKDDNSDKGKKCQQVCDNSLPDPKEKERIWAAITNMESELSVQEQDILIEGFFRRNHQLDLLEPYFDKFMEILPEIIKKKDKDIANPFMNMLSPAFLAREKDVETFNNFLKNEELCEKSYFKQFVQKALETIEKVKKSKELCAAAKTD